ncbi:hydantoinase/oxoprolinase family protein [Candidatus Poribacteria bacterium]|nr:hydantoinase/oxoprolinase family protein [Candidatus Poribacteria bacterium]MYA58554.1 hydantoinase/oxoprolinase family protein [Candidatus Poribacteria bacterium]
MEHRPDLIVKNIGVDTGGTFTDIVMRVNGDLFTHKVLSTPQNPALAVIQGVSEILHQHDTDTERKPDIVHGSTVATNALLERRGARIALVTTKDFEDILEIGRQARPDLYDFCVERPAPLVPADRRFGISERTLHTGEIQTEIEPSDLEALTSELSALELDAIAVCFLFAYVNPHNEQIVANYLSRLGIPVSCSHEVLPEYREYARFSTTVANAYIRPTLERHLSTLIDSDLLRSFSETVACIVPQAHTRLAPMEGGSNTKNVEKQSADTYPQGKIKKPFRLMLSNGGCISAKIFQRSLQAENLRYSRESAGIRTVLSGPAGGVIGAYQVAKAAGYDQIITFDMGGTSTDVSLCNSGISLTTESTISGLPIKVPLIDINTVGAGGGSIATVDAGGALRVGPESAGADPGPICYGNNGTDVTVTDANLYLGRIAAAQFLGGAMSLDADKTRTHIEEFAKRLGVPLLQAADGILKVANAAMERAIKVISVERGFDTRDFTLVSFGGAGGLHAAFMAENLGIETVLIPPNGGLLSAYGMLFADVVKDYSRTVLWQFEKNSEGSENLVKALNTGFGTLLTRAENEMEIEGFAPHQLKIDRSLDMRYQGQSYELNIACPPDKGGYGGLTEHTSSNEIVETLVAKFHATHEVRFGYARTDAPVEVVNLRLTATGETDKPPIASVPIADADAAEAFTVQNPVIFEGEVLPTNFYRREALRPGNRIAGPAIVTEFSATTVVPPDFFAVVDTYQNLVLSKE